MNAVGAAAVGGLVGFFLALIGQNFLVERQLFDQPLDFLHANMAAHDQPEIGVRNSPLVLPLQVRTSNEDTFSGPGCCLKMIVARA